MEIKNWIFYYDNFEPLTCQAPCTMYSILLEHNKIPDPFYGNNEQKLTSLSDKDCSFESHFQVTSEMLKEDFIELTFHGLDTICSISLNGSLLDRVMNMHRSYTYEVKSLLFEGENSIRLDFNSPTKYFTEKNQRHYLYTNDGDTLSGAAHLRKALFMSGWDWGPALPDMGIFRPVTLKAYSIDRIKDIEIIQHHHDGIVVLDIFATTVKNSDKKLYASIDEKKVEIIQGHCQIQINNPKLWWVRGYGEQNLYNLDVTLEDNDTILDCCHKEIGLRTITVSTEPDADKKGSEFCFVINGIKIFAMGANYVPQDNLLGRITHEKMDEMMQQCLDGNFNTLRVWGGGIYPDDYFFELCDRNGILVWLDFMIACANVWMTEEFTAQCKAEARENLLRLRHHACLGLICGNNEMELAVMNWGIGNSQLVREDYIQLYERILPQIAEELAPNIFYWPSSPCSGGGFDDPGNFAKGDTHYWDVWHGGVPFTSYRQNHFRFCSEYGFEAFPSIKTIREFCPPEEMNCFSEIMETHQKCKGGNGKILRYLADNYLYPTSFEKLVYASQLLQADAIKYGVEHFRRERGYCMGSIYWQFNDSWPVASWSSVDSKGRYKALHYAAKKFYAPVSMGLFLEGKKLTINVSNETRNDFNGKILFAIKKSDFSLLEEKQYPVSISNLSSKDICSITLETEQTNDTFIVAELYDETGKFIMRQTELFVPCKHFKWTKPNFTIHFEDTKEGVDISISSSSFARGVALDFHHYDCVLSDNYFSLTDKKPYHIFARTNKTAKELSENYILQSVYDIR